MKREIIHVAGKLGVFRRNAEGGERPFEAFFQLAHVATGLALPLVFERALNAVTAASIVDGLCDWDAFVQSIRDQTSFHLDIEPHLMRHLFAITDNNLGVVIDGPIIDAQRVSLKKRLPADHEEAEA